MQINKKTIQILMKLTKTDELRDMYYAIGNWANKLDWTYREEPLYNHNKFMRAFVIGCFWLSYAPIWTLSDLRADARTYGEDVEKMISEIKDIFEQLGI